MKTIIYYVITNKKHCYKFRQFGDHLQATKAHKIKGTTAGSFSVVRQITNIIKK